MAGVAHYDMVKHFDFEKLPGSYQVARNFSIGFGWPGVPARVIVLCGQPSYVCRIGVSPQNKPVWSR
jgi:hypothetical protein